MLKWFRLYNKYILAVGGALLMVAFLIQGTLSMLHPTPADEPLGAIGGQEITRGDQMQAAREIAIINRVHPILSPLTPEDPMQWLLMLHEAQTMGISASNHEVAELLTSLSISDEQLIQIARSLNEPRDAVRQTIKNWLILQHYKELVLGSSHEPVQYRLSQLSAIFQQFEQLQQAPQFMRQYYLGMLMQEMNRLAGAKPRVSQPLLERFVSDQQANVKVAILQIPDAHYLDKVAPPDDATLMGLFNQYKGNLPGASTPYGFGYKFPDRVRVEYLAVPLTRLLAVSKVTEADAVRYYDRNQTEFMLPATATPEATGEGANAGKDAVVNVKQIKPYDEVRAQIISQLKREEAARLGDRIIKSAQAMLFDDVRNLRQNEGYRDIPADWTPTPLEKVAAQLQEQFGVLPDVYSEGETWHGRQSLATIPGIGGSFLEGQTGAGFPDYAMSARELNPAKENPMANLRLQVKLPSVPLRGADGSRFLFRLIDAQATREPASLDEVREQVVADARRVAAFELAKADQQTWVERLSKDSLQAIAAELKTTVAEPQPFQRREMNFGRFGTPHVDPIGINQDFVDDVFEFAGKVLDAGELARLAPDKRTGVIPVEAALSVCLVRIDEFQPMTRSTYERSVAFPQLPGWIMEAVLKDAGQLDPFSVKAISKRVGYVSKYPMEEGELSGG